MKRGGYLKRSRFKPKRSPHDWAKMTEETYSNANGICELCGGYVLYGTLPAHIIPRSPTDFSLDENWNTALLHIAEPCCHSIFDADRAQAVRDMKASGGCRLLTRIHEHPRLSKYFDILEARKQYREDMKEMQND